MKTVLLDSSCIVALLDRSETHHRRCVETVSSLPKIFITCEAVIAETCFLLKDIRGASSAVLENIERGIFKIPLQLNEHAAAIKKLMAKYADVPMSLADACLVRLAEEYKSDHLLTLDTDFRIYRWGKSKPFYLPLLET